MILILAKTNYVWYLVYIRESNLNQIQECIHANNSFKILGE